MGGACRKTVVVREAESRVGFRGGVVRGVGGSKTWNVATITRSKPS
jgi:hypothetical protein